MRHDPERDAGLYLGGAMSRRTRRRFEQHMIGCEHCWHEVQSARRGRALAESSRELAPQHLRELVRSTVEVSPARQHTPGAVMVFLAAGAALALLVSFLVLRPSQPDTIETLLADFAGTDQLPGQPPASMPTVLGDLVLVEVREGIVEEVFVVGHEYADPAGHVVVVYQSDSTFPVALGADHGASGATWSATSDETVMFCADRPVPSLVIGDDERQVRLAVNELELR